MNGLREQLINNYKEEYYNNAKIDHYKKSSVLKFYNLDELSKLDKDWFPLCCYIEKDTNKIIYGGRDNVIHTYTEGETGSGKTTRIVIQSINALSNLKNQPSFIVVDPYGEIYESMYGILKQRNYDIKVLNCDEPFKSDTYNPFESLIRKVLHDKEISYEVQSQIRKICDLIIPISKADDPIWEQGACSYLNGLILDSFEDLLNDEIDPSSINLYNIIEKHYWLRSQLSELSERNIFKIPKYEKKGHSSLAVQKMISVTNNAERTRDCYYGVFENCIERFGHQSVYKLSSNNTIDLENLIDVPTCIFVQVGSSSIGDDLVSLLINDMYNVAIRIGKKMPMKRLPRNLHCFIDEFANCNFGRGEEFIKMLTTSRKFGMFWHMYLQCDSQLDKKYNSPEIGNIIRANSTEIFLGSQDYSTIERFASSCGKKTIESINSRLYKNETSFDVVNLITTDKLMNTPVGHMYIKLNKSPLLYSYFEAFYNCDEFKQTNMTIEYPTNEFDYTATLHKIPDEKKKNNFDLFFDDLPDKYEEFTRKLKWIVTDKGNKILVADIGKYEVDLYDDVPATIESDLKLVKSPSIHIDKDKDPYEVDIDFELMIHIDPYKVDSLLNELNDYTCIPFCLKNRIELPTANNKLNSRELKFDIISTFIKSNDFDNISDWSNQLAQEIEKMEYKDLLPPPVIEIFKLAYMEVQNFTMNNINEIKKLVNE